jgi:hypothetical protein
VKQEYVIIGLGLAYLYLRKPPVPEPDPDNAPPGYTWDGNKYVPVIPPYTYPYQPDRKIWHFTFEFEDINILSIDDAKCGVGLRDNGNVPVPAVIHIRVLNSVTNVELKHIMQGYDLGNNDTEVDTVFIQDDNVDVGTPCTLLHAYAYITDPIESVRYTELAYGAYRTRGCT